MGDNALISTSTPFDEAKKYTEISMWEIQLWEKRFTCNLCFRVK